MRENLNPNEYTEITVTIKTRIPLQARSEDGQPNSLPATKDFFRNLAERYAQHCHNYQEVQDRLSVTIEATNYRTPDPKPVVIGNRTDVIIEPKIK